MIRDESHTFVLYTFRAKGTESLECAGINQGGRMLRRLTYNIIELWQYNGKTTKRVIEDADRELDVDLRPRSSEDLFSPSFMTAQSTSQTYILPHVGADVGVPHDP